MATICCCTPGEPHVEDCGLGRLEAVVPHNPPAELLIFALGHTSPVKATWPRRFWERLAGRGRFSS